MKLMDIGEVVHQSGVSPSTLRYYEQKGLIKSKGRHGLRRLFDQNVLQQLALIKLGQEAGFSLAEIGSMFSAKGLLDVDRAMCLEKANEIDQTIKRLSNVSRLLRHTAACPADSHLECPTFMRYLNLASARGGQGK